MTIPCRDDRHGGIRCRRRRCDGATTARRTSGSETHHRMNKPLLAGRYGMRPGVRFCRVARSKTVLCNLLGSSRENVEAVVLDDQQFVTTASGQRLNKPYGSMKPGRKNQRQATPDGFLRSGKPERPAERQGTYKHLLIHEIKIAMKRSRCRG